MVPKLQLSALSKPIFFFFANISCQHIFHVIPNNISITYDGILGLDFFKKYDCTLNFNESNLTALIENIQVILPIHCSSSINTIIIPARCLIIKKVTYTALKNEILIQNQKIALGIFVARALISREKPCIKILNINSENIEIPRVAIKYESLKGQSLI